MSAKIRSLINKHHNGDYDAGRKAAMLPEANPSQLEELSHSPHAETRSAVAANNNTSHDTLARLAYDPDISVAAAVARRKTLTREFIDILVLRAAADYTSLRGRERAHVLDLAVALADNCEMSITDVENLMKQIPTSHLPRLIAEHTERDDLLKYFAKHSKETVRLECLKNKNISKDVAQFLINDISSKVSEKAEELYSDKFSDDLSLSEEDLCKTHEDFYFALLSEIDSIKSKYGIADDNSFFSENLSGSGKLLHFGCQNGTLIRELSKQHPAIEYSGICLTDTNLSECRKQCEDALFDLWSPDGNAGTRSFDTVILTDFLQFRNPATSYLADAINLLADEGVFRGTFLCAAGDSFAADIFTDIAESYGFIFEDYNEAQMNIATCGLVIENISGFKPINDILTLQSPLVDKPLWSEIINEVIAESAENTNNILGYIEVKGKKLDIK
ncbi:MAG: hypothetical protein ACYTFY_00350 [Planctomycetota bacterium]|jgi:hypothetical protein